MSALTSRVVVIRGADAGEERSLARQAAWRAVRAVIGSDADVAIRYTKGRAPLARSYGKRRLWLSLSHRDGRAAAAASRLRQVGIDLERVERIPVTRARYFLSEEERRTLGHLPLAVLWCLKESAWKALDLSTDVPFHALTLRPGRNRIIRSVEIGGREIEASAQVARPWRGWILTLVELERPR